MKNLTTHYSTPKQGILPLFFSDYLDICDRVFTFDELMEEVNLEQYLKNIPEHETGRIRYNLVDMLKTVLFGFMDEGYIKEDGTPEEVIQNWRNRALNAHRFWEERIYRIRSNFNKK